MIPGIRWSLVSTSDCGNELICSVPAPQGTAVSGAGTREHPQCSDIDTTFWYESAGASRLIAIFDRPVTFDIVSTIKMVYFSLKNLD